MAFPATYNLSIYKGDTYEFVVLPKSASGGTFSLLNYTPTMKVASSRGANPTFSESAQAVLIDTNDGVICTILPSLSSLLSASVTYVYDVQVSSGATNVYTLLTGSITVTEDIS